jgi:hypothetical protein
MAYCINIVIRCVFVIRSFWTGLRCWSSLNFAPSFPDMSNAASFWSNILKKCRVVDVVEPILLQILPNSCDNVGVLIHEESIPLLTKHLGIGVENATLLFPGNEFIFDLSSLDEILCECNNFADIQCTTQVSCSDKVSLKDNFT